MSIIQRLGCVALLCFVWCGFAQAQNCSFTVTPIEFGAVDVTANTTISGSGTFSASCTGTAGRPLLICPNFGSGSGGSNPDGSLRQMTNGTSYLNYNLYKNAAMTNVWGSFVHGFGTATPPPMTMTLNASGRGNKSRTLYAKITAAQQTTPIGAYQSVISGYDSQVFYAYDTGQTCDTLNGALQGSPSFIVQTSIIPRCTVSASELNFGSIGVINRTVDASNTISVVCTAGAPYSIGLDGGVSGANNPAQRKMKFGAYEILYGLYRDSARGLPWGLSADGLAQGGTGTGAAQNFKSFGRVPVQRTPPAGSYADTIVVTVTY